MFLTEEEILGTSAALKLTCDYFGQNAEMIDAFFAANAQRKFTVMGCGSSYMLSKSAAAVLASFPETAANAIPAGDYIADPAFWQDTVRGSIVLMLSRSGRTSEMVWAARKIKQSLGCPIISINAEADNDITPMSDLELSMPWCHDNSVCQTRTVTNLYAAALLLAARYAKDDGLWQSVHDAAAGNEAFQAKYRPVLEELAAQDWDNAVVLADGPVCGIAEEGALAFTEIAMLTGRYFHLLDYRHGPIVISGEKTITVMLLRPGEEKLQGAMARDVIRHGGTVVTVSEREENVYGAAAHIQITGIDNFAACGIPFIYIPQMTALLKSVSLGGNPDQPKGLDAYISLK